MKPESANRRRALFDAAADLETAEQAAFLERRCCDEAVRDEVAELLRHDVAEEPEFLRSPFAACGDGTGALNGAQAASPLPAHVGRYEILRLLGQGGMGVVYEATQDNPRRVVALKVIHSGLTSARHIKRFRQESLILGRLEHPGIARIYEAGTAVQGEGALRYEQPYFAMELVRGTPLAAYPTTGDLGRRTVLTLMTQVCDAVQHAHEQGVVHRDLKPANILINESGQPKVLDFGVARLLDADLEARSLQTDVGQVLGTVPYMSPEQIAGRPDETGPRSDVYALGVILFELLAGHLPLDVRYCGLAEAARVIRDREPSRLSSVHSVFRGDVDTIVAKAMEKDPARRYASAGELGADLRRHLADEPVTARPVSAVYQLRKFAKRNRALVGGVGATFVALLFGLAGMAWLAGSEAEQRREAQESTARAERVSYQASIAAAEHAVRAHDHRVALDSLKGAPERLRGWEWRHLRARLDDHLFVHPADGADALGFSQLDFSRDGKALHAIARRQADGGDASWPVVVDLMSGELRRAQHAPGNASTRQRPTKGRVSEITSDRVLRGIGVDLVLTSSGKGLAVVDLRARTRTLLVDAPPPYDDTVTSSKDRTLMAYQVGETGGTQILVHDLTTGRRLHAFPSRGQAPTAMAFSPDNSRLVTGSSNGTLRQWNLERGGQGDWDEARGHADRIRAIAHSDDGSRIATAAWDETIRIWDATSGETLAVYGAPDPWPRGLWFCADGARVVSLSAGGVVRGWGGGPAVAPRILRGHTLFVEQLALRPDGALLASGAWDGTVRFWDPGSGQPVATLHPGAKPLARVAALAFSPDGSRLAAVGFPRGVTWRSERAPPKPLLFMIDAATGESRTIDRVGGAQPGVAFHPDGRRLAYTHVDGEHVVVVDADTFSQVARLEGTCCDAFGPAETRLMATHAGNRALLYDTTTWERVHALVGHEGLVLATAFSLDGRRMATGSKDNTVRVWDTRSGKQLAILRGHSAAVLTVTFSPDGSRIASGSSDHGIRIWDASTYDHLCTLRGHTNHVDSLVFSPDGRRLYSGSGDHTVRIWEEDPLRVRVTADERRAQLLDGAERYVANLWDRLGSAEAIATHVRSDGSLSDPLRDVALQVLLRTSIARWAGAK